MTAPILVVGVTGQLAVSLAEAAPARGLPVECVGPPRLDFDRPESVRQVFAGSAPTLVVNAAAYTAVDAAEDDARGELLVVEAEALHDAFDHGLLVALVVDDEVFRVADGRLPGDT